jgi:2-C-methyl-D-erythritol 4-phosphate cytidylyltransferase
LFKNQKAAAVIASGGQGTRMNAKLPKQYLTLAGQPILARTLAVFRDCKWLDQIILVTPSCWIDYTIENILKPLGIEKTVHITAGGETRRQSVYQGLLAADADLVIIHDSVRPFISQDDIRRVLEAARNCGACTLGAPVKETIKECDGKGFVRRTLPREALWQIQTPQCFAYPLIRQAHEQAAERLEATDDASLVERLGKPVRILPGSYANIKITTEEDLVLGEYLARSDL